MATDLAKFAARLAEAGAEILEPTNPYEELRFKTKLGVGVVYRGRRGRTWNMQAAAARDHLKSRKGSLAPVKVRGPRKDNAALDLLEVLERARIELYRRAEESNQPLDTELAADIEHAIAKAKGEPA